MNASLEFPAALHDILGREGLHRKRHVHDARRMSLCGGKIDESSFSEKVNRAPIVQSVAIDEIANVFAGVGGAVDSSWRAFTFSESTKRSSRRI